MSSDTENITAIILAAGEGKRMGQPKALVEIDGVSFLEQIIAKLRDTNFEPIIVVGGANANQVEKQCTQLEVHFVENKSWQSGQFSSLKVGLAAREIGTDGILIALVDHPFVETRTYQRLREAHFKHPDSIIIPVYQGKRGHPTIIPHKIANEINAAPNGLNLREIIRGHQNLLVELPVDDVGILKDIDTIQDLEEINS
jgi:molybdenum cofactor cytidylyltransferase